VSIDSIRTNQEWRFELGQFRIFLHGCAEPLAVEIAASSMTEVERLAGGRFLACDMMDFADEYGVCMNRAALVPTSRIQLIVEHEQ
jgi:hypothetical protein